ncbi:MAG: D-tyrosyl-tRNA(Tyr) deacylase [Deltaproteobacteria bacterium]|nr:D-tyrosyl-tRNA(Tyr) deacylase [Deltaproteobacteria bacterium]
MRAVVQRVSRAAVRVEGQVVGEIGPGLLVLLGVAPGDGEREAAWMADKLAALRIFEDAEGKMNRSVTDEGGGLLVVSQFTLYGDAKKGNRPSFTGAAPPEPASALYERVCALLRQKRLPVAQGVFRAMMSVELTNEGPVTILLETPAPPGGAPTA